MQPGNTEWRVRATRALHSSARRGAPLLVTALLASCTQTPPTGSAGSSTAATDMAAAATTEAARPGEATGFRGGVLAGINVDLTPGKLVDDVTWNVDTAEPIRASITLITQLLDSNCEDFPTDLACPTREETILRHHLSALVNFDRRLVLEGTQAGDSVSVVHKGPGRLSDTFAATIPPLADDLCLVVGAFEDEAVITRGQFADHSVTGLTVGSAEPDDVRCDAPPLTGDWWPIDADQVLPGECALPFLTREARSYASQIPEAATGVFAVLPHCGEESFAVFAVDGVLQGRDDPLPPVRLPTSEGLGMVIPVDPPEGSLRVVVVTPPHGDQPPDTGASRPFTVP